MELTKEMEKELLSNKGEEPAEAEIKTVGSLFGFGLGGGNDEGK